MRSTLPHHAGGRGGREQMPKDSKRPRAPRKDADAGAIPEDVLDSILFLTDLSHRFEAEGNLPESVKSAESALLLRCAHSNKSQNLPVPAESASRSSAGEGGADTLPPAAAVPESGETGSAVNPSRRLLTGSVLQQAEELIQRCNSYAVLEFQSKRYDTAAFLLNKALYLTEDVGPGGWEAGHASGEAGGDAGSEVVPSNSSMDEPADRATEPARIALDVFEGSAHTRMRLRAATFNNVACLQKRRGKLESALDFLLKAAQLETAVEPDVGASPSTYLNLCTIYNKLGRYTPAIAAAGRAVDAIVFLGQQSSKKEYPNLGAMLVVALYNLGVSHTLRGEPGDSSAAAAAFNRSVMASRMHQLESHSLGTVETALQVAQRVRDSLVPAIPGDHGGTDSHQGLRSASPPEGTAPARPSSSGVDIPFFYADPRATRQLTLAAGPIRPSASLGSPLGGSSAALGGGGTLSTAQKRDDIPRSLRMRDVAGSPSGDGDGARVAAPASPSAGSSTGGGVAQPLQGSRRGPPTLTLKAPGAVSESQAALKADVVTARGGGLGSVTSLPSLTPHPPLFTRQVFLGLSQSEMPATPPNTDANSRPQPQPPKADVSSMLTRPVLTHGATSSTYPGPVRPALPSIPSASERLPLPAPVQMPLSARWNAIKRLDVQPVGILRPAATLPSSQRPGIVSHATPGERSGIAAVHATAIGVDDARFSKEDSSLSKTKIDEGSGKLSHSTRSGDLASQLHAQSTSSTFARMGSGVSRCNASNSRDQPRQTSINPLTRRLFHSSATALEREPQEVTARKPANGERTRSGFESDGASSISFSHESVGLIPNHNSVVEIDAIKKHMTRVKSREKRKSYYASHTEELLRRSQRNRMKEKEMQRIQARKREASQNEEMAEKLYRRMIHGIEAEELRRANAAATQIQRRWKGCLARSLLCRMAVAVRRLQAAVRHFLERRRAQRAAERIREERRRAEEVKLQSAAVMVIQRRVHQFLRRLSIRRAFTARQRRLYYSARTIQRGFRRFLRTREERITAQIKAQRLKEEQRALQELNAARTIQSCYRAYTCRIALHAAVREAVRVAKAASRIKAFFRGVATRSWFREQMAVRRMQELHAEKYRVHFVRIQGLFRGALARRRVRELRERIAHAAQQRALALAATKIQCAWRCHQARVDVAPRRIALHYKKLAAQMIQRNGRGFLSRTHAAHMQRQRREATAVGRIEAWYTQCVARAKERELARYHRALLLERQRELVRNYSACIVQGMLLGRLSSLIVESVRRSYWRDVRVAHTLQAVGRGYMARVDAALTHRCVQEVLVQDEQLAVQTRAVEVVARVYRCYRARVALHQLKRQRAASVVISRNLKMYVAKRKAEQLRVANRRREVEVAARVVQRRFRRQQRRRREVEVERYHLDRRASRLRALRVAEAATKIQAMWRGFTTRHVVSAHRRWLAHLAAHATQIQRAWRAFRLRQYMRDVVDRRRVAQRALHAAARRIQCFWRRVLAAQAVARAREDKLRREAGATAIQCAWRQWLAVRELLVRRLARAEQARQRALLRAQWDGLVSVVNAYLRTRAVQHTLVERKRQYIFHQLTEQEKETYFRRIHSAVAIQAAFRGYLVRRQFRGARPLSPSLDQSAAAESERMSRAAWTIQRPVRQWLARRVVERLRAVKRAGEMEEYLEHIESIDPQDVVRELFWAHETVLQRDLRKARLGRVESQEQAATRIQRMMRRWRCRREYLAAKARVEREAAARAIQVMWLAQQARRFEQEQRRRERAATYLQARVRGYLVRREWDEWKQLLVAQQQQQVLVDDVCDHAAMVIQTAWRRYLAIRVVTRLREEKLASDADRHVNDAARVIQRSFRRFQRRRGAPSPPATR